MEITLRQEIPPPTVHPASLVLKPSNPARHQSASYYRETLQKSVQA